MNPDDERSRIARLEEQARALKHDVERIERRTDEHDTELDLVIKLTETVDHLGEALVDLRDAFNKMSEGMRIRDNLLIAEKGLNRRALWGIVGTLSVALVTIAGAVLIKAIYG